MFDKSPQGHYDSDIVSLLEKINKKFRTTSSCSGRIVLVKGERKGGVSWLYKNHAQADAQEIYALVQEHGVLRFMYEPLIVHFQCLNEKEAEKILITLQLSGFKKSCCISFKHYTIEINDTGRMETIFTKELPFSYVENIVLEANKRLGETKKNIEKLEKLFV